MKQGSWQEAKFIAWENQHGICPICGKRIYLTERSKELRAVGHHIENRAKGGKDTPENCEVRHAACETLAHQIVKNGNPTKSQLTEHKMAR